MASSLSRRFPQATVVHTGYTPPTDNLSAAILGGAIIVSATVMIIKQLMSRCKSDD